jgi:hypothetical protein
VRVFAFLLATGLTGCTVPQARIAKRAGEVTAAAALAGMLASVVAAEAWHDERKPLLEGGFVFVPISLIGVGVYIACDALLAPEQTAPSEQTSVWNAAMDLAREAKHAARAGDCAEVQAIEPRVRDLDSDVYLRFENDRVIRTCLGPH